jgi:hypothetical protein
MAADVKDPRFYAAIFGNDDRAAPDLTAEELHQARQYIVHGKGNSPVRQSWAKPPLSSQDSTLLSVKPGC